MQTITLSINDIEIEVIRKKIKSLRFCIYPPHGRVRVSVPLATRDETVRLAILEKMDWIKGHQAKFQQQVQYHPREFQSGEQHYFQGQLYQLEVQETTSQPRVIVQSDNILRLQVRPNASQLQRQTVLYEWYRQQLKASIPPLLTLWQANLAVSVAKWGIKTMKTRWGSCNPSTRRVWFNTELAKSDPNCLEYVVVHELVHLLEASHNHRFKSFMDQHLPNWRETRKGLIY